MAQTNKIKHVMGLVICAIAAIFYCYEFLLRMEPSVMVPELMSEFQVNATELGILSAVYYFIYTPMQLVAGMLSDLFGSRKVLTAAIILCAAGSFIFGVAHTVMTAAMGRLLIGLGSAFAFVNVLRLSAVWLPLRFFALFAGLATALGMLGAMIGDVVLMSLVHSIGWKATVNLGTIAGVILIPIIWLLVHDMPRAKAAITNKLSYRATLLGWLQMVKNPQMWLIGAIGCLMYLSLSMFAELWGIPFLNKVYQMPDHDAAVACSLVFCGWLVGGPLVGYISDYFTRRKFLLMLGCLGGAIVISIIIFVPNISHMWLCVLLFLFGVFPSAQILVFALSRENSGNALIATGASFTNFLVMVGGIIFQPLVGKLLDMIWHGTMVNGIRSYSAVDYQQALVILPIAFLIGFLLSCKLEVRR